MTQLLILPLRESLDMIQREHISAFISFFRHYPELATTGDGWDVDWTIKTSVPVAVHQAVENRDDILRTLNPPRPPYFGCA